MWGLGTHNSEFYSSEMSSERKWRGEGKNNEEIGKMFYRRKLDVCAQCGTKLNGTSEAMFSEVAGMVSLALGEGGRGREWRCY